MNDMEIARDDLALDAIAAGRVPDVSDDALGLLAALRTDLDETVAATPTVVPSTRVVVPLRPRRPRSGTWVALAAAAGIVVGGITAGAVAVADRPGEFLYAAHSAILGKEDHSVADVTKLLDDASGALARGDRAAARRLLARAEAAIPAVPEADRAALRERLALLRGYAAEPAPSATPSVDDHGGHGSGESAEPGDDNGGSGSDDSGSGSGSSGSGSDDTSGSGSSGSGSDDTSGSGSSGDSGSGGSDDATVDSSGSGSSGSGSGGSDDGKVTVSLTPDTSDHGGGDDSGGGDD